MDSEPKSADKASVEKPTAPIFAAKAVSPEVPSHHSKWHVPGIVFLSFIASFLGSWVFLGTGLVDVDGDTNITQSRQTVLAEGEVVADVAKTVSPSVVSIVAESVTESRLFGPTSQEGAGTGIIISADGYVLTNKHVIPENTQSVTIVLADGTTYDNVEVIGRDPLNDIAFLKIANVKNLTAAKLADSGSMSVGQKVVAIGNALGQYQSTVTSGIISGTGRSVTASDGTPEGEEQLENLFQTDAAINPGNSGGPLVNLNGEVIGINTAVSSDAEGIGFAIPINDAKGLIKGVLANGQIQRAYLGVRYVTITPAVAKELELSRNVGAYVGGSESNAIIPGGPADKAGLKEGDIITHVDGVKLTDKVVLISQLSQRLPGDKIKLTILRDGKAQEIQATLERFRT